MKRPQMRCGSETTYSAKIMRNLPHWAATRTVIYIFLKEDFIRKSTKTTYKIYTYMYIPPPAAYTNTIHNTKCSVYNG